MWAPVYFLDQAVPCEFLALDQCDFGPAGREVIAKQRPDWKYAERGAEWDAGFLEYLGYVRHVLERVGFGVIANHTLRYAEDDALWPQFWAALGAGTTNKSPRGAMTERPLRWEGHQYSDDEWERAMRRHEDILDRDLIDWWVCYPGWYWWTWLDEFSFNYCSWKLIQEPGLSYFYATRNDARSSNPVPGHYAEYDLPLGQAAGSRFQVGKCWARWYQHGSVIVNPTYDIQKVEVGGGFCWLHPMSGRIVRH
jgi:hypothetical protein